MVAFILPLLLTSADMTPAAGTPPAPLVFHYHIQFTKVSRENCARRAVDLLLNRELFLHAEVLPDGSVQGWNEQTSVLLLSHPYRQGAHFFVLVAGRDNKETGRLIGDLRKRLDSDGEEANEPIRRVEGVARQTAAPRLRWGSEPRGTANILRFFQQAGMIVLEKHGLRAGNGGGPNQPTALGVQGDRGVVLFLLPGPNEVSVQVFSVGIGPDAAEADRLQRVSRRDVLKVLFE